MKISGPVWALGAMSGTSLDGVDAAMLETDGQDIFAFGETAYRAYSDTERSVLRAALGCWPGEDGVAEAAQVTEDAHIALLSEFKGAALIGFHGQTLAHDPAGRGTHQAGSGQRLADALGLPVVSDFRSADVGFGGEGAPLAPFYHFACARWMRADKPIVFLNLGGVGNLTWVNPLAKAPEDAGACLAFDTGPANAPIDDLMRARRGQNSDTDGALAATGKVDLSVVEAFLTNPYFARLAPKSLDRNGFPELAELVAPLNDADAAATLTAIVAASVADGLRLCPAPPDGVLVTGGGRRNPVLMRMLSAGCSCPVLPVEEAGLDGDMLEAQAFAYLAVRAARGLPTSAPGTTGVRAAIGGGIISQPSV